MLLQVQTTNHSIYPCLQTLQTASFWEQDSIAFSCPSSLEVRRAHIICFAQCNVCHFGADALLDFPCHVEMSLHLYLLGSVSPHDKHPYQSALSMLHVQKNKLSASKSSDSSISGHKSDSATFKNYLLNKQISAFLRNFCLSVIYLLGLIREP